MPGGRMPGQGGPGGMRGLLNWLNPGALAVREQSRIADQNLAQQERVFQYQKGLQSEIFEREDTSVQRRVEDLKGAGMSPILAAGQGARAGAPISVTAPQKSMAGAQARMVEGQNRIANVRSVAEVGLTKAQSTLVKAQADKVKSETQRTLQTTGYEADQFGQYLDKQFLENKYLRDSLEDRIGQVMESRQSTFLRNVGQQHKNILSSIEYGYAQELRDFIQAKGKGGLNPAQVEFLSAELLMEIRKKDLKFYNMLKGAQIASGVVRVIGALR